MEFDLDDVGRVKIVHIEIDDMYFEFEEDWKVDPEGTLNSQLEILAEIHPKLEQHSGVYMKDILFDLNPRYKVEALLENTQPDGNSYKLWFVFFVSEFFEPIHMLVEKNLSSSIWDNFRTAKDVIEPPV